MSFFDDASLVFLPSGEAGKDGKAYSMKPTNGDGDFTFSRGSNLTATRVDSNGLIEKGRENLLLKSNLFDNGGVSPTAWATSNASVSSGQSGYDGSTDAWLLQANSDGGGRRLQQSITQGGVSTLSIYAKAGTTDWIRIEFVGASSYVYFDLTNGVLGSETNAIGKIESIGNGWYRCSAVNISGSTPSTMRYILASANNNVNVVTGDNIYIQDAQLEIGLVATEYIESGATTGKAGLLEDSPRFDFSGGASCPSLLLEPSRTQLLPYSEYYNGWTQSGTTLTTNTTETLSPEGLYNASKLVGNGTSGVINSGIAKTGSVVVSVYLKSVSGSVNVTFKDPYGGLANEVKSVTTEWQRFDFIGDNGFSFAGFWIDDIPASGIYMWGAQLEQGSYISSYMPNHSGGSVTRAADVCEGAGTSSTFNDSEGVLYAEIAAIADDLTFRSISLSDGTNNNRVIIRYRTTSNVINFLIAAGGSVIRNIQHSVTDITDYHKLAIKYKDRDIGVFVDGAKVATYNDTFTLSSLNEVSFTDGSGSDIFYGKPKQILVFNTALSDSQLITLTS